MTALTFAGSAASPAALHSAKVQVAAVSATAPCLIVLLMVDYLVTSRVVNWKFVPQQRPMRAADCTCSSDFMPEFASIVPAPIAPERLPSCPERTIS